MKKFLLAALAIFGLAAPIGATLPQSGHAYKIKHQASNLWLNTEIDGRGDATGRHCASLETEENASILFFIQNPENEAQWEIRTAFSEGPILASSTGWVSIIDNAKPFYWGLTEQADGSFVITRNAEADSSKNVFAPDNNTATSPLWTDKWKSDKSNWIIGEEVPTVEVTYKYPAYKTHPQIIKNVIAGVGANTTNFLPVRPDFFTTSGVSEENKIISETNKEFNVAGTWSYPIEANHVYRMKLKPSETASKFMHFDGNEANLTYTDIEQDAFSTDFFWYFTAGTMTENGQIPVTLHGMSMTANQGLEFGTGDESNGHQSTTPTVWYIRPTTLAAEGYRDFMLQHTEKNAENGMDVFINYRGGKVSTWSTITYEGGAKDDAGCVFRAYDLLESDWDEMATGDATAQEIADAKADPTVTNVQAIINKMSVPATDVTNAINAGDYIANTLGLGSEADIQEWNDFKETIPNVNKVSPSKYALLTSAVNSLVYNASIHIPADGKPMMFRHVSTSTDESANYLGLYNGMLRNNGQTGKRIFTLKAVAEDSEVHGFYLYNEYADKYVDFPSTLSDTPSTVYIFDMYSDYANPTFGIRKADGTGNIFLNNNGDNHNITGNIKNAGSEWKLETATATAATNEFVAGRLEATTKVVNNGNALSALGVCSDEAVAAWNAASQALSNATLTSSSTSSEMAAYIALFSAANAAYADLQKKVKKVSINAKHKVCNRDYIGANAAGTEILVAHENNATNSGTRALTLEMSADGSGFNIFNEYTAKYIVHPTKNNNNVTLTATKADATIYNFDVNYASATDISYGFHAISVTSGPYYFNTNDNLTVLTRWDFIDGNGTIIDGSCWYITPISEDIAANEYLAGSKVFYTPSMAGSTAMGEYGLNGQDKIDIENALAMTESASADEKRVAGNTLRHPQLSLNMPQPGHIYMFSDKDKGKYMSSELTDDNFPKMVEPTTANLLSRLFYLDENSHLVALQDGKVLGAFKSTDKGHDGHSWATVLLSNTDKVGVFSFSEAATHGKYVVAAQGERNLFNKTADQVDCGGGPGPEGYHWTIEDYNESSLWTPLPDTNKDHITLLLPFAMHRRNGMTLYTAQEADGKITLKEFTDDVIPANTPFVVDFNGVQRDADNHFVYLEKAATEGTVPANNALQGSIYAMTNPGYAVREGNHFERPAQANQVINGFTAYLPEPRPVSDPAIESAIDGLVGKVFAIKNADTGNNRGYLISQDGNESIWTTNKLQLTNAAADAEYATNPNYRWTLVKDANGLRYLYNLAAGKFASAYMPNEKAVAEFYWHFSDRPTAIDFCFLDYDPTTNLEDATFNIIGGETNHATRPGGMMIVNGHPNPVPSTAGDYTNDGCGFQIKLIEDATLGDVASPDAALAEMAAEHAEAKDYIDSHNEDMCLLPGHYNATAYTAFANALKVDAADTQGKYYQLVRARNAAGANAINQFEDGALYVFPNIYANVYLLANKKFYTAVEDHALDLVDENGNKHEGTSNTWQCVKDADGNVNFTHPFSGFTGYTMVDKPAAVRARFAATQGDSGIVNVNMFDNHVTPTYKNAYGAIEGGNQNLSVASLGNDEDMNTTGIAEVIAADRADATVYDLQGRRVAKATRGLYIVNGQKSLLK